MLATVPQGTRMPRIVHQLGMAEPVAVSCSVQDLIANPGGRLRWADGSVQRSSSGYLGLQLTLSDPEG